MIGAIFLILGHFFSYVMLHNNIMLSVAAGRILLTYNNNKDIELLISYVVYRIGLASADLSCTILE